MFCRTWFIISKQNPIRTLANLTKVRALIQRHFPFPPPLPLFLVPLVHLVVIRCCFISYWISKKRQFIYLTWWTTFICPDVLNIGDFSGFAINQKNPPPQQEYLYLLLRSFPSFVGIHCGEQEWKFMFFFCTGYTMFWNSLAYYLGFSLTNTWVIS